MDGVPITFLAVAGDFSDLLDKDPLPQILALIVGTFISEDLTCLGSAWLSADGRMALWVAWAGCFLGIWMGDAGLYMIARWAGRPFTEQWFPDSWTKGESIIKAEQWIQKKGTQWLWITRFVPGTRLPTYLAAGYLRMNVSLFLCVTGLACLIWTTLLFWLAHSVGRELIPWLERFRWGAWIGLLGLVLVWVLFRRILNFHKKRSHSHE